MKTVHVIDGREISKKVLASVRADVSALGFTPKLIDVVVGNDPVIAQYVGIKRRRAADVGIEFEERSFPADVPEADLVAAVRELNSLPHVCGIIVQLPLPAHLDKEHVVNAIDPRLDVDAITATSGGLLLSGQLDMLPPTAGAVLYMLDAENVEVAGKHVLVVGAGDLVGKPVAVLLVQRKATVTIANSQTKNLGDLCRAADVVVSAAGVPGLIKADMVSERAVVIDAGTSDTVVGISGDVDYVNVSQKVAAVSPVPGGVGPVTVAMLLKNVALVAASVASHG